MPGHVAIVGAGVIGTACAYYLAKSGWRVTLLDRGRVGGGCSHGNCGYVSPSHVLPIAGPGVVWSTLKTLFQKNSPLKVRLGTALANFGWFRNFARRCNERDMLAAADGIHAMLDASRKLYDDFLRDEQQWNVEWDTSGLLFVFHSEKAFEHFAHIDDLLQSRFQVTANRIGKSELLAREPSLKPESVSGAFHFTNDAQLRPDRLMQAWRSTIVRLGVTIIENCEIRDFSGNVLQTSCDPVKADAYVFATGAWTPQLQSLIGCKIPILPGKGYSITMPRPALCPNHPLIFEEHRVAISPFQSGYRIGSTMEFAGYDDSLNRNRLTLLRDVASIYLKEPLAQPVQEEWWGWRPMVYDGKPIIDFSPKFNYVVIAAGHGMLGLSMATGTGKLVCELLNGTTPHVEPSHYSFSRF